VSLEGKTMKHIVATSTGEDCDLTVAYMLGRRDASDELARKAVKLALEKAAITANAQASPVVGTPYSVGGRVFSEAIRALDPDDIIYEAMENYNSKTN
jgi:hypothetical protein